MKSNKKIILTLALTLGLASTVNAQEIPNLPDAGITPDSPLYFLDKLGEDMGLMFTFGEEAKLKKQMENLQERLSEVNKLQTEGKTQAVGEAIDEYNKNVSVAAQAVAQASQSGVGFSEALNNLLATTNNISQTVLARVYSQVPEQAKLGIQNAMQAANGDMEGAIKAAQQAQIQKSQGIVNDGLQKARNNAPEAAKQYIPENINVDDYVNTDGSVKDYNQNVPTGEYADPKFQENLNKDIENVKREVDEAVNAANVGGSVGGVNVQDVKVPEIKVPSVGAQR